MDLLDNFRTDLPHLADKVAQAAEEICALETLLDGAEASGLPHIACGWKTLKEVFVQIKSAHGAGWLNHLARHGYQAFSASCDDKGTITAHLKQPSGGYVALIFETEKVTA